VAGGKCRMQSASRNSFRYGPHRRCGGGGGARGNLPIQGFGRSFFRSGPRMGERGGNVAGNVADCQDAGIITPGPSGSYPAFESLPSDPRLK